MRLIEFASAGDSLAVRDTSGGGGVRDLWDVNRHLQLDLNIRLDASGGDSAFSPRVGVRYTPDDDGRTTVKASAGRFVGFVPLSARAFGQYPARADTSFSPSTGRPIQSLGYQPVAGDLELPRADGIALEIEQRVREGP